MTLSSPAGYDAESRLLASSRAGVTTAQRTLDAVGNTISITDANSNTTRTAYDLANRVTQVTAANTDNSKTTYDAVGNVLTKTDGSGRTTVYTYDKRSRKTSETNFAGDKTEYSYDRAGNMLSTKKPIGTWTYSFDAANRLKTVTTPETHVTSYTYDKNNNNLTVKNANLHTLSTMVYNARNRLIGMTYPNGEAESYRYDANDNRIGRTDANGKVHTMVFDAWNRLISQSAPTTIPTQVALSVLTYDGNNNLLSTVETLGDGSLKTELNQYDGRDRLIQTTDRNGRVLKYGYDLASNQTTYTDSDGITSERTFDKKNRLIKTLRATLGAILLAYTGADELRTITHPNGTETNRTFDQAGRLASITVSQGAVTVSQRVYTFDRNGNRLTQVEKNGGAAESSNYEYDLDNRLLKVIGPDQTEEYTIDAAGNRKTEVVKNLSNVVLANKTYTYNSREQLLSVADGAVTTTYLYDGNGNQTSVKVGTAPATIYTWGPRDQLASLSTGEAFEYDSAGHRTAKTAGGNRTLYIWSGDQLMAETNTIGNSLSQVTRVGSLLLGEVRGGVAQHFDQDAFNSVIVTTLSDGTIPGRLSYQAFGQVRSLTGNVATPFRFNGYVSDGGDELSSPSRFYSMGNGRFTSMDPVAMDPMNPITGNPFVGMNANPLYYLDPDGRCSSPTLCSLGYGFAYAKNDAERTAVFEGALNETPSLGRTYGALKGASHLVMAPVNVGTDAADAMFGDTQARTRTAQRLVALSQESEANARSLVLGPSGPTYRLTAMFVGGVATHAGQMSEAIEQRNYVGQGQAGFDLGMDTLVVAGGASIGVSALRATSMGRTVGSGISSVELPLAQQAEIAAAQDAKMMQIAQGPAVVVENASGSTTLQPSGLSTVTGSYDALRADSTIPGQAHHLNQDAIYGARIPHADATTVKLEGNAFTEPNTPHYVVHNSQEIYMDQFRKKSGARYGERPTHLELNRAVLDALRKAGYTSVEAKTLVNAAIRDRVKYNILGGELIPRLPRKMGQVKTK